jgi:hypothetical protein
MSTSWQVADHSLVSEAPAGGYSSTSDNQPAEAGCEVREMSPYVEESRDPEASAAVAVVLIVILVAAALLIGYFLWYAPGQRPAAAGDNIDIDIVVPTPPAEQNGGAQPQPERDTPPDRDRPPERPLPEESMDTL